MEIIRRFNLKSNDRNNPAAMHSSGLIAFQKGQYDRAIDLISKAIEQNPQNSQFHNSIGAVYKTLGKLQKAADAYRRAILLNPAFGEGYSNLGFVLLLQGRPRVAIEKCKKAVQLKPDFAQAYNNLGLALQIEGEVAEAIENFTQAIKIEPKYAQAYSNLGTALKTEGRFDEAAQNHKRAIQIAPNFAEAYNNLGWVLNAQGKDDEAIENYREALRLKPDYAAAHWNLSFVLLRSGRLIEGWNEFEWRTDPSLQYVTYPGCTPDKCWDGSSFVGKRLLVRCEQGFGDNIHFVRYLPMVKARGGTVIYESRKPLLKLLCSVDGIDELIEATDDGKSDAKFDYYIPLLSLAKIFGTTLETIPAHVPYIHADPTKARYWRDRMEGPDFKVGIVWSGSTGFEMNEVRACRLEHFTRLAEIEGVTLYSLQKGTPAEQIGQMGDKISVVNIADEFEDFADTAAMIENLDLVISADTAVVHLAGAMNKPIWTVLCYKSAWQWMLNRDDSPWYPTMKLFRQKKWGDWHGVFSDVTEQLRKVVGKNKTEILKVKV